MDRKSHKRECISWLWARVMLWKWFSRKPRGPNSDFVFIFHFSIFVFHFLIFTSPFSFSVFIFYFSVFVFNVLIFTSPFSFSVENSADTCYKLTAHTLIVPLCSKNIFPVIFQSRRLRSSVNENLTNRR